MKKFILLVLLLAAAQLSASVYAPTHAAFSNGDTWDVLNNGGATVTSWEEIPSGSPATVLVTVQGCMRGNTCDSVADTNTSTSAAIRGVTFTKAYAYFHVAVTLTGGTNPTIVINPLLVTTSSGNTGSGGNGTVTNVSAISTQIAVANPTTTPALSFSNPTIFTNPIQVNSVGTPTQIDLTPSLTAQAAVLGASSLGAPATVVTAGVYRLPGTPATGVWYGTNVAGIVSNAIINNPVLADVTLTNQGGSGVQCAHFDNAGVLTKAGTGECGTSSGATISGTPAAPQAAQWASATALAGVTPTGTGIPVYQTSSTLITPALGVATATSVTTTGAIVGGTSIVAGTNGGTGGSLGTKGATSGECDITVNATGTTQTDSCSFNPVNITATGNLSAAASGNLRWTGRSVMSSNADGRVLVSNNAGTGFTRFAFAAETTSAPAFGVSGTTLTMQLGDGTAGGTFASSALAFGGTKFTASGCSNSTTLGGASGGSYTSGTTGACTVTVTMGDTETATNGWTCWASDSTTPANIYQQSGSTTTTATFTGTTISGDVLRFGCFKY